MIKHFVSHLVPVTKMWLSVATYKRKNVFSNLLIEYIDK